MNQEITTLVIQAKEHEKLSQRHEAFATLVTRFQAAAWQWAYQTLGDRHLAQDAVQEAFVVAYQNLNQLRQPEAFAGWLRQVVLSQCHRLLRSQRFRTHSIDEAEDLPMSEEPAGIVETIEMRDKVMAAIEALPEHEQVVTQMFYLSGYSLAEIARLLELPMTTVKKRLQYARQHLKTIMVAMLAPATPAPVPALIPVSQSPRRPRTRRGETF